MYVTQFKTPFYYSMLIYECYLCKLHDTSYIYDTRQIFWSIIKNKNISRAYNTILNRLE